MEKTANDTVYSRGHLCCCTTSINCISIWKMQDNKITINQITYSLDTIHDTEIDPYSLNRQPTTPVYIKQGD